MTAPRRRALGAAAGALLFLLALAFGAGAADPLGALRVVDDALLRAHGAVTQRFRSRHDRTLLTVVQLGKLSEPVPVVLVHGLGASTDYWTRTALWLAKSGRTVLMIDMPGSGASDAPASPDGYSLPARVGAISSLVAALGLDRIDLVGHSLGGWTSGLYAIAEPHHVRRLVLVDAAGFYVAGTAEVDAVKRTLVPRARGESSGLVDLLFARPPFPRAGFVVSALARIYAGRNVAETVARFSENELLAGREALLPSGTVLVWGEKDVFLPIADARRSAAKIPGARLLVITGVGHDGPLEAPREFRRALASALESKAEVAR